MRRGPIAVFDSGVGGLSILREIRRVLPAEELLYFADQVHVPYGPRPAEEVRRFSEGIARFLIGRGAGVVVVACNTASAAALHPLRAAFPGAAFVGMEPAVKPAAERSRTGAIGVLATPGTLQGQPFCSVVERFARGVRVCVSTGPGLVEAIEAGETDGPRVRGLAAQAVAPLLAAGIDTLVLGCTHYPLILSVIREACGPGVAVIDPAPAVARQAARLAGARGAAAAAARRGRVTCFTTGRREVLAPLLPRFLGESPEVVEAAWGAEGLAVREAAG